MAESYLTARELEMIVRRARGEYAVNEVVAKIHREKAKTAPRDCPYMAFLNVVCARREPSWPEVEPVMRAVLALHPPEPTPPIKVSPKAKTIRAPRSDAPTETVPLTDDFGGPIIGTAKLTKQPDGTITAEGTIDGPLEGSKLKDALHALTKPWKTAGG